MNLKFVYRKTDDLFYIVGLGFSLMRGFIFSYQAAFHAFVDNIISVSRISFGADRFHFSHTPAHPVAGQIIKVH